MHPRQSVFDTNFPPPYSWLMDVEVTVRNYRCFSDTPVRFALKKGLQSFVGVNNSGKSCLLRLFYELRGIFLSLPSYQGVLNSLANQGAKGFSQAPAIKDPNEIFYDRNNRDLVLGFELNLAPNPGLTVPGRFEIVIPRGTNTWLSKLYLDGNQVTMNDVAVDQAGIVRRPGTGADLFSLIPLVELFTTLSKMLYLGPD